MKTLLNITLIAILTFTSAVFAHGDGHGAMTETRALSIARAVTKAMTFKDRGYSAGKLDESWNKVSRQAYKVVEENSEEVIIKVTNASNQQTLFVKLNHSGSVIDVKNDGDFITGHGHQH